MELKDISIATMTWARSKGEEKTLRAALRILASLGAPVVAADGGSPPAFIQFMRRLRIEVVSPKGRGLVPQIRESLQRAHDQFQTPFILYTEPDKAPFFADNLTRFVGKCAPAASPAVFIPDRDRKSFATFPEGQRLTETFTNRITEALLGPKGDYTYGPLLMPRGLVASAREIPNSLGWGWRAFMLVRAVKKGLKLSHIRLPLPCPEDQRGENSQADQLYRARQLKQYLDALLPALEK